MKKIILLCIIYFTGCAAYAQVTIGSTAPPAKGALLELKEKTPTSPATDNTTATKGMLLPRLYLTDAGQLYPMFESTPGSGTAGSDYDTAAEKQELDALHTGLTVYNLTDNDTFCPGVYTWDGALWKRLMDSCCPDLVMVDAGGSLSQRVYAGSPVTVGAVSAVYDTGLEHATTYQWYMTPYALNTGGMAIPGATGPTFTLTAAETTTVMGTFYFYCVASNTCRIESMPSAVYTVEIRNGNVQ